MTKPYLGIWVDHREAYFIWVDEKGEAELQHAAAEYPEARERTGRAMSGRTGVYGGVAPHASVREKQQREARRFYETIFRAIRGAQKVYIFGPGQAKRELRKRLGQHKGFTGEIVAVESAQKMTEATMTAEVRQFFGFPRSAV